MAFFQLAATYELTNRTFKNIYESCFYTKKTLKF